MDFREVTEFFRDTFKYIVVVIVVLIIVIYVITLQQIIGPSMEPTLYAGDVVLLSKIHYKLFDIKRNDIVSIKHSSEKFLVKRIIGLPGEHIKYENNILYINNSPYEENIYKDMITDDFTLEDIDYYKIPDNMYLVLGDNRGDSLDSRQIGLIKNTDIVGKAIFQIWPLVRFGLIK